ncbi:hypothetical protein GCM10023205_30360 [Yinghuangia aomiensis]|uniref:WxL domain surface cell wall-binding n=1 Tax=Yinghuangia aomiensis TaxID=676205 RepID=A0ABP9H8T7_9ACTN
MFESRKKVSAGLGAVVIAGSAGLVAVAPAATAATATYQVHCALPAGQPPVDGSQSVTVDLSPASSAPGGSIEATVTLGPSPATSPVPLTGVDMTPSITFAQSGGAGGQVTVTGPTIKADIPGAPTPISTPPYKGTFTVPAGAAGLVNLVPVKTVTKTVTPFGTFETTCDVTGGTDVVASYTAKQPPADPTLVASPGSVEQNSQLGLSGTKWEGNVTKVSLCDAGGANCQALPAQLYSLNVANGNLTGGVQIVDQVPPGTYTVKVESDAPQSKTSNSFTVTGVPPVTASASPSSGDLGQATVVSGDNWVKSGNVTLQGQKSDGTATTDAPVTVATDANGHFSSPYTVNDKNTAKINVSGGGKSANAAYTPKFGQQLGQDASGTVNSGGLSFQQAAAGIQLSPITLNGKPQTMTGALNQVAVQDFRGDVLGWDLTGQITDFTNPEKGGVIPANSFSWKPACAVTNPASPSQVVTGSEGNVGLLCKQNANAPGVVSGGEFTADASTKLAVPAWQLSGTYTATLTLTLI